MYVAPRQRRSFGAVDDGAGAAGAAPWLLLVVGGAIVWLVLRKPARKYVPDRGNYDSIGGR